MLKVILIIMLMLMMSFTSRRPGSIQRTVGGTEGRVETLETPGAHHRPCCEIKSFEKKSEKLVLAHRPVY